MASKSLGTLTLDLIAKIGGFTGPMDKAGRNAKKNSSDISKSIKAVGVAAGVMGVAAAAGFAALVKSQINAADEMIKLSRAVGLPVETLSELNHAADLSGVSLEALGKGVKTFSKNISEAFLDGVGPGADALADLGIGLTDVDGKLKTTDALIAEVADRFAVMEDGAIKTALAQELFGKSGTGMINMLNGGSKALRESAEEARRLGIVIGKDAAESAERFNDNMRRLQLSLKGVANEVAQDVAPALAEMTEIFADPEVQSGIASMATGIVKVGTAAVQALADVSAFTVFIAESIARFTNGAAMDDIVGLEQELDGVTEKITAMEDLLSGSAFARGYKMLGSPSLLFTESSSEALQTLKDEAAQLRELIDSAGQVAVNAAARTQELAVISMHDADGWGAVFDELNEDVNKFSATQIAARRAADEATEAQKKATAALSDEYDKTVAALEREIALHGVKSRAAIAAYDLEHGALAKLDPLRKQAILDYEKMLETLDASAEFAAGLDEGMQSAFEGMIAANGDLGKSAEQLGDIYTGTFERISGYGSDMLYGLATDSENAFGGIAENFTRMLSEMANEALMKPILLNIQQGFGGMGGGAGAFAGGASQGVSAGAAGMNSAIGGSSSSGAMGAMGAGGFYAVAAIAVVAAVNNWNKEQDEKFLKMTAEYRQGTQSTGTLLGMANAKSESIGNLLEDMSGQYDDVLSVNYGMYRALLDIRTGIAGVASGFARSIGMSASESVGGMATGTSAIFSHSSFSPVRKTADLFSNLADSIGEKGAAFGLDFMAAIGDKITKELFKQKIKLSDAGIEFMGNSLQEILAGGMIDAIGYIDYTSEKKVFGISLGKKLKTETTGLDDLMITQITGVFENAGEALREASNIFGIDFEANLSKLLIDPQKLSLKDLEGDALAKEIEAFFSSTLDNWAGVLLDGTAVLHDFQQVGEGAFETMLRLATETNQLAQMLEFVGQSFGGMGLDAIYLTQQLADLAGGFDVLNTNLGSYYDKFFTDQEKLANLTGQLSDATSGLLDTLPATHAEFRSIIDALDLTTEAGAAAFAELIALSPAMDAYLTALEREGTATKTAADNLSNFMRSFVAQIDKANLSDFAAAVYDLNSNLADALKSAQDLGASEEDLALIRRASAYDMLDLQRGQTDNVLANLRNSIDAEIDSQASIYANAVDELAREFDARVASLDGWLETQLNHFERRSKTLSESIRDLSDLSNALGNAIGVLKIDSEELNRARYFDATSSLSAMAASVGSGGALPSADIINALAANLGNGKDFFSTAEEYADASATALNAIALLKGEADDQLTTAEKSLAAIERSEQTARDNHERMLARMQADREKEQAALDKNHNEQLARLEAQYQTFVTQVEVLRGIDSSVATVEQAVAAMNEAIANELTALREADNDKYDEVIAALEAIASSTHTSATIARTEQLEAAEAA